MHHPSIQDSANAALVSSAKGTAIMAKTNYWGGVQDYAAPSKDDGDGSAKSSKWGLTR